MPSATYELIETKTVTTPLTTLSFTDIPATFNDLKVVISVRNSVSNGYTLNLRLNINSSTGAYPYWMIYSSFSTSVNYGNPQSNNYLETQAVPGGAADQYIFSNKEIYIPDYSTSGNNKCLNIYSASTALESTDYRYQWNTAGSSSAVTAPITRLDFLASDSGNLTTGSEIRLYGIKNS